MKGFGHGVPFRGRLAAQDSPVYRLQERICGARDGFGPGHSFFTMLLNEHENA
jgi:hypothetical protein